jgi:hypothetical protein
MFNPPESMISPWYSTDTAATLLGDIIIDNQHGNPRNPPPGAHVVLAWEMPNSTSGMSFYIFGDTALVQKGNNFIYSLALGYSLPKHIVRFLPTDTLAIAHVFLAAPGMLHNGDTLSFSGLATDSRIIGALEDEVIAFRKGTPSINGASGAIILDDTHCGRNTSGTYMILHGLKFPGETRIHDVSPDFGFGPGIQIDDDKGEMAQRNPFWMQ